MDRETWAKTAELLDSDAEIELTRDQALDYLNTSRRLKAPLQPGQAAKISAIVEKTAPEGFQKSVEQYGSLHRHIWRKRGTLLPSESGDDTP